MNVQYEFNSVADILELEFSKLMEQNIRALTKRNECSDGKITPDEFGEWMEAYFPNRKKKA